MGGSKRTPLTLRLEPLEGRSVPSGLLVALQAHAPHLNAAQVAQVASTQAGNATAQAASYDAGVYSANGTINTAAATGTPTPAGPNAAVSFPPSPLLGNGTPTRAELARERFVARFSGPMVTLAPRFSDQSKILYMHGLGGSSTKFFLHGDYALALAFPAGFNPKNPTASGTVTGFAFLDDKNNNSGATVGFDLSADPTSFDAKGRPTRLFFTSDPNIYSGIFYVSQSAGVATIKYGRNTATTTFNGRLYVSGLTSPFQNLQQYAQHSG